MPGERRNIQGLESLAVIFSHQVPGWERWSSCHPTRYSRAEINRLWWPLGPNGDEHTAEAKAICATCPVRDQCRELGADTERGKAIELRSGIWGGTTPTERAVADGIPAVTPPKAAKKKPKPKAAQKASKSSPTLWTDCDCGCGERFNAMASAGGYQRMWPRRFATPSCKLRWRAAQQGKKPMSTLATCPVCGDSFQPYTTFDGRAVRTKRKYDKSECLRTVLRRPKSEKRA